MSKLTDTEIQARNQREQIQYLKDWADGLARIAERQAKAVDDLCRACSKWADESAAEINAAFEDFARVAAKVKWPKVKL